MPETRNLVSPEQAEANREREGTYTFHAPIAREYEGVAVTVAAIRLGDHAHLDVESGRATAGPHARVQARPTRGHAGRLVLRWEEWLELRAALDASPFVHVCEVEAPTLGQVIRYTVPDPRVDRRRALALALAAVGVTPAVADVPQEEWDELLSSGLVTLWTSGARADEPLLTDAGRAELDRLIRPQP